MNVKIEYTLSLLVATCLTWTSGVAWPEIKIISSRFDDWYNAKTFEIQGPITVKKGLRLHVFNIFISIITGTPLNI